MNGKHYIGRKAKNISLGIKQPPISKIVLNGSDDRVFVEGDDSGYILEIYVPTATAEMAKDILKRVKGFAYQGFVANNAFISPTAELGDGIDVKGVYGLLARREFNFTPKMTENISAPYGTEEDHEYGYEGSIQQALKKKVTLGSFYYGTRITRQKGIEIVKTDDNVEKSYAIFNSDKLAFYDDDGREVFYFEPAIGTFKITQYANVEGALEGSEAFSQMNLTIDQFQVQLSNAEGNINILKLTAAGLQNQITSTDGNVAILQNTVNGFSSIYATKTGVTNEIKNSIEGITLSASNGTSSSTISVKSGNVTISSATVKFTGDIIFANNLTDGITRISGNNIKTGYIDADRLNLYGPMEVYEYDGGDLGGYIGYIEGEAYNDNGSVRSTEGIGVKAPGDAGYEGGGLFCTNAGARLTYGEDMFGDTSTIACVGQHCYSSRTMEVFSDRRLKNSIKYDLLDRYKEFYKTLKPCRFKMNSERNGNYHIGFIAQEVATSLDNQGIPITELEALTQFKNRDGSEGMYAIGYSEFVAMNTAMIQDLMSQIDFLKYEISELKELS